MNLPQSADNPQDVAPPASDATSPGISPHRLAYLLDRWAVYNLKASNAQHMRDIASLDLRARELARSVPDLVKEIRRLDGLLHGRPAR